MVMPVRGGVYFAFPLICRIFLYYAKGKKRLVEVGGEDGERGYVGKGTWLTLQGMIDKSC